MSTFNRSFRPDELEKPDLVRFKGAKFIYSSDNGRTWKNQEGSTPVVWQMPSSSSTELENAMSDDGHGTKQSTTSSDRARRRLSKDAALAPAGTSAGVAVCSGGTATLATEVSPSICPDVHVPMKDVQGKGAFITGGSSGIGLGIARAFADAGMKVVIGYRTEKHLEDAMKYLKSAGDRIHAIKVDVTDRCRMEKAAEETTKIFGKVHVLVNNAGVAHPAPLSSTTYDDWDWLMDVNLNGVFNGVHAFLPRIQAHGEGGQIITTSSIMGFFVLGGRAAAYSVSKFAVVGMMESLRAELADTNIGASVFCPGLVSSNIMDSMRNRPSTRADTRFKPDPEMRVRERELRTDPELAMDPFEAGQLVLRGMCNNDLYILTHPEYEQIMRDRNEALMASIPTDLRPTEARLAMARSGLRNSIYAMQRDRKRCARRSCQTR